MRETLATNTSVRLPVSLLDRVRQMAEAQERTAGWIIRKAIATYVGHDQDGDRNGET